MQTKTQRKRTPKTPRTPEQVALDKAIETLVKESIFTGEGGFRELVHEVSKSFLQAALRGELTAHLNEEKEAAVPELPDTVGTNKNKSNGTFEAKPRFSGSRGFSHRDRSVTSF